jgi:hypothetical protein
MDTDRVHPNGAFNFLVSKISLVSTDLMYKEIQTYDTSLMRVHLFPLANSEPVDGFHEIWYGYYANKTSPPLYFLVSYN